ncbi:hypothetical protein CC86DRAFT_304601 [Ophiobolus disseminans]|uniref:DUF4360 domain-containing protein n=1 Tax=Ophiobolus disseminans TaxID=1469910 RepID=A0A6A6ZKF2_9PLEO|nr:hypothetical protein CC86DRAFT_304601 [Ophiobolus disseminans]
MKYTFATLALAAATVATPVPGAASAAPSSFRITNVVSAGSGCPQGSIDVKWTDNKIFPIYFNREFTAKVGSGKDVVDSRKNCQINLKLEYEQGFSFAVYSADYAGWADLDNGVTGTVKATYYFSGEQDQTSSAVTLDGPFHGKYYKSDDVPLAVWSPCGKGEALFNVNSEVYLNPIATPAQGVLASTREGGRLTNNLYFQWKKC